MENYFNDINNSLNIIQNNLQQNDFFNKYELEKKIQKEIEEIKCLENSKDKIDGSQEIIKILQLKSLLSEFQNKLTSNKSNYSQNIEQSQQIIKGEYQTLLDQIQNIVKLQDKSSIIKKEEINEKKIYQGSKSISLSINKIYKQYEESNNEDGIINKIKKFSTMQLISAFGNNLENYSVTYNYIYHELFNPNDGRLKLDNIINYLESEKNINEKTRQFLLGQVIIGLAARVKINELDKLVNLYPEKIWLIIENILNYQSENIFKRSAYLGLLQGMEALINKNNFIAEKMKEYFKRINNEALKNALINNFTFQNNEKLLKNFLGSDYYNNNYFKNSLNKINKISINVELLSNSPKDFVYLYGGNSSGGGLEFFEQEISQNIKKNTKILPTYLNQSNINTDTPYVILENEGVREIFINNNKISKINEFVMKNKIQPLGFVLRGHNYNTLSIIKKNINLFQLYNKAFIIDGGCKNSSQIENYRTLGITNHLLTYDHTGKGNITYKLTNEIIEFAKNNNKKNIKKTWYEFRESLELKKNNNYELEYICHNIKFPGNIIDNISSENNK